MYFIAYAMQLLTLICALGGSALALLQLWQQRGAALALIEKVHWGISAGTFKQNRRTSGFQSGGCGVDNGSALCL